MGFFLAIWGAAVGLGYTSIAVDYSHSTYHQRETARIERMLAKDTPPIVVPEESNIPWLTERSKKEYKMWADRHGK